MMHLPYVRRRGPQCSDPANDWGDIRSGRAFCRKADASQSDLSDARSGPRDGGAVRHIQDSANLFVSFLFLLMLSDHTVDRPPTTDPSLLVIR